jgi:hypothetical protein
METLQDESGRAGYGNGCDHGRRGCFPFKIDPGLRLSQQPTAEKTQSTTAKEHQGDRYCLFIDKHTLGQKRMNRFQKVVNIKAAPSDDLDFPKGSQTKGIISIHEWHSSLDEGEAAHGLERKPFDSQHFSIAQRIRSGLLTFLELSSEHGLKLDVNRRKGVTQRGTQG